MEKHITPSEEILDLVQFLYESDVKRFRQDYNELPKYSGQPWSSVTVRYFGGQTYFEGPKGFDKELNDKSSALLIVWGKDGKQYALYLGDLTDEVKLKLHSILFK